MSEWRNRIIETRTVTASELSKNASNWRRHPAAQAKAIRGLLNEVGIVAPLIAYHSARAGGALTLIDGHMRQETGGAWPVTILDVTDEEADLVLSTFDPISGLAEMDGAALAELLGRVEMTPIEDDGVRELLAQLAEQSGANVAKTDVDAEPQIDRAEELRVKWGVNTGDLWQLGDHRLICGDCTDAAVVARVMGGERATLAPVDPPYNVGFDYDGETVDDSKAAATYEEFSRAWFAVCQSVSERQIVTPGGQNLPLWVKWFDCFHIGAWTKPFSTTNGKVAHLWSWEPMFFFGDKWPRNRANDVFEYGIQYDPKLQGVHPCPKPIALWIDILENYSEAGDLIYEAFCGSGTTLIACEQLGRKCRAIEISPAYCAVALDRWATATGQQPTLLEAA